MKVPVTYVVVPEVRMRVIRVDFHPLNKKVLVQEIAAGKIGREIYPKQMARRTLWSKAKVKRRMMIGCV